jgi:transposase
VPVIPSSNIEPIWDQFAALLPDRMDAHPSGCHRPRIPDRVVFDKLVQVLVSGCAYHRIADTTVSTTTLRRRRDEWIAAGVMGTLLDLVLGAYDRMIGLALDDLAIDCCFTKAPCGGEMAGRSPAARGKQRLKRSLAVDASGIPLGTFAASANRHDLPLLAPTHEVLGRTDAPMTIHRDLGYDSVCTRQGLIEQGLRGETATRGKPAPIAVGKRWVVERTTSWTNAHQKLVWCTERRAAVTAPWIAFSTAIIAMGLLVREARTRSRWGTRPSRKPLCQPHWRRLAIARFSDRPRCHSSSQGIAVGSEYTPSVSACGAFALRRLAEVRHGAGLRLLDGAGNAVALNVLDQPVHLGDFLALGLTDPHRELAHAHILDVGTLGAGDR